MYIRKIIKTGNSHSVVIPARILRAMKLLGEYVVIDLKKTKNEGSRIEIRRATKDGKLLSLPKIYGKQTKETKEKTDSLPILMA